MLEVNLLLLTFLIKKQLTITLLRTTYVYTDSHNTHWISEGKVVYSRIIKKESIMMRALINGVVSIVKLVIVLYAVYYAFEYGIVERIINMF